MANDYVAQLTETQLIAHQKIEALYKVYDAAKEVLAASDILDAFPDDGKSQDRWSDAISDLDAAFWNTAGILKQPRYINYATEDKKEQ